MVHYSQCINGYHAKSESHMDDSDVPIFYENLHISKCIPVFPKALGAEVGDYG